MVLEIEEQDNRFRVKWQGYSTDWLPDTTANRKSMVMFLRLLMDGEGRHIFPFQQLSAVVGSQKRQASSQHVEDFRESGCDFLGFLTRKRKIDAEVVEAVRQELVNDPLAETTQLQQRVNERLNRENPCLRRGRLYHQITSEWHWVRYHARK